MIYTSYFAMARHASLDTVCLSIARSSVIGFRGISFPILAPSAFLLSQYKQNLVTTEEYTAIYQTMLDTLDPREILAEILTLARDAEDIWLCCWERPTAFCHRHLVARWFNAALPKLDIHEWVKPAA